MDFDGAAPSPALRARLAEKGRILYRKSCGPSDGKTCAESFALRQIQSGQAQIAQDLLEFLETEAEALRRDDPDKRLAHTEELIIRIRCHLSDELLRFPK
jgi:hypothetical protein